MAEEKKTAVKKPAAPKAAPVKAAAPKATAKPVAEKKPTPVKAEKPKKEKATAPYETNGEMTVTLTGGLQGCTKRQLRTVKALGLSKIGDSKVHKDNPAIRGMCKIAEHLVKVEKA